MTRRLYSNQDIENTHQEDLAKAVAAVAWLGPDVVNTGKVFEHTVRRCLQRELGRAGYDYPVCLQKPIKGAARADLAVGVVAIEVKLKGFFGSDVKYGEHKKALADLGYRYLYINLRERYDPYVAVARKHFGSENAFFLDRDPNAWDSFVRAVIAANIVKTPAKPQPLLDLFGD